MGVISFIDKILNKVVSCLSTGRHSIRLNVSLRSWLMARSIAGQSLTAHASQNTYEYVFNILFFKKVALFIIGFIKCVLIHSINALWHKSHPRTQVFQLNFHFLLLISSLLKHRRICASDN